MALDAYLKEQIDSALFSETQEKQDYFTLIKKVIAQENIDQQARKQYLDFLYEQVRREILYNDGKPESAVKFGTSGWRGILGKDLFCKSVAQVTYAIVLMYKRLSEDNEIAEALGVASLEEAQKRGCVVGFDNRFCGDVLARVAVDVLEQEGFVVYYAGESTTGVLSAAVLQLRAAFSINFTPSHNPLEYGGLKYNASDGGPAGAVLTSFITKQSNQLIDEDFLPPLFSFDKFGDDVAMGRSVQIVDSFSLWQKHVRDNLDKHGLDYDQIIDQLRDKKDLVVAVDSVHGASRLHMEAMFKGLSSDRILHLRNDADVTFGGVSPEPSSANMKTVVEILQKSDEPYTLGAIIDPDGDRIRFTDGRKEISMNQFGAMAFHFLHEWKNKKGMVAKTVATSNLANNIAEKLGEDVFEPAVGFKEFKPVIGSALVYFEESDGISIIGHTPEKDAYIGLLLAINMVLATGKNLSDYLLEIEDKFGHFYPDRDGIEVSLKGDELLNTLSKLEKYRVGAVVKVGSEEKKIEKVIAIDGRKMIFEDGSWVMIRPSGTEPKVRFYVEARTADGCSSLVQAAKSMLDEIGLL